MEFQINVGTHQRGCSPDNAVTLGIPVTPALKSWRGMELNGPGIVNFGSGSEFEGVSGRAFGGLSASVPVQLLIKISDQMGLPLPDDFMTSGLLPVHNRLSDLHSIVNQGRVLLGGNGVSFGNLQQDNFAAGLVSIARNSQRFDDRSANSLRAKRVARAIEFMENKMDKEMSIGRLCAETGTSWRTLSRGFKERFGIGPKAYFNRCRLGRVRSELLKGAASNGVMNAANNWGFWHMGQFAKDYRNMFGELPSMTGKCASFSAN
jgi:methylphosphotriester-DNA--protein-cysteine methyltransferase